ncbi:hypothetical protein FPOAC2_07642 [Fusarium poae]
MMISHTLLHLLLLPIAGLPRLAAAGADPSAYPGDAGQQLPNLAIVLMNGSSSTEEGEQLMEECDASITACATTADVKIIRTHASTKYVTNLHVFESVSTVSTSTRTFTQVKVSTKTTSVEGQCRDTTIYEEPTPLTVTVDVNTTTVKEFVHIVPTTITTVSIVEHKQTAQCIIKRTSMGLVSSALPGSPSDRAGNASGSVQPAPGISSSPGNVPSVEPSVDDFNSAQAETGDSPSITDVEDGEDEDTR